MLQPKDIIGVYYDALYSGDLETVKSLMTEVSYFMTLESFGLRLSFRDAAFKTLLEKVQEDGVALKKVEELLSKDMLSREYTPNIEIQNIEDNGDKRQTINYTEDEKPKKLYFSKEENGWKINYYAGRKVA